jgi:hypothetical protein
MSASGLTGQAFSLREGRREGGVVARVARPLTQERRVQRHALLCAHFLQRFGIGVCDVGLDSGARHVEQQLGCPVRYVAIADCAGNQSGEDTVEGRGVQVLRSLHGQACSEGQAIKLGVGLAVARLLSAP